MTRSSSLYLGDEELVGCVVEQDRHHVLVSLLAGDMKRRVEVLGGGVRRCPVLQQQQHVVGVTEPCSDVQRRLLLLDAIADRYSTN